MPGFETSTEVGDSVRSRTRARNQRCRERWHSRWRRDRKAPAKSTRARPDRAVFGPLEIVGQSPVVVAAHV